LYEASPAVLQALERASESSEAQLSGDAGSAELLAAEEEEAAALVALEVQLWLELDLLLRTLAKLRGSRIAVPAQCLGLLPPPPAAGWPETFTLGGIAGQLRDRFEGAISEGEVDAAVRLQTYVPAADAYPSQRRAQRMSHAVWAVIGGPEVDFQEVLEASSTRERIRLALLRLRGLMEQLA